MAQELRHSDIYFKLLAARPGRMVVWPEESSHTPESLAVSTPVPERPSRLFWRPSGVPESADPLHLRTHQGGYPGSPQASWQWQADGGQWMGWDAPTVTTGVDTVWREPSGPGYLPAALVSVPDLDLLAAVMRESSTGAGKLQIITREGGSWEGDALDSSNTEAFHTGGYAGHPIDASMAYIRGRLHFYVLAPDELSEQTQVLLCTVGFGEEGGDFTWEPTGVLLEPVSHAADPVDGIEVGYSGGQFVAFLMQDGEAHQYESGDGGFALRMVGSSTIASGPGLRVLGTDEGLLVAWADGTTIYASRLSRAGELLSDAEKVEVRTTTSTSNVRMDLAHGPDGYTYLYLTHDGTSNARPEVWVSSDYGATWRGENGPIGRRWAGARTSSATVRAVWHRGRVEMLRAGGVSGTAVVATSLGGYTNLTLPWVTSGYEPSGRASWTHEWLPDAQSWGFAFDTTGTSGCTYSTNETAMRVATGGNATQVAQAMTGGSCRAREVAIRGAAEVTGGQMQWRARTDDHGAYVSQTDTTLRLLDLFDGAQVGASVTVSGPIEVQVSVRTVNGQGHARAFWRPRGDLAWQELASTSSLSSSPGSAEGRLVIQDSTDGTIWAIQMAIPQDTFPDPSGLGRGWAYDYDLVEGGIGRALTAVPLYATRGIYVASGGGPTLAGDTWTLTPDGAIPLEQATYSPTYPSREAPYVSGADGGSDVLRLAWKLGDTAELLPPTLAIWVESNAPVFEVEVHDGDGWTLLGEYSKAVPVDLDNHDRTAIPAASPSGNGKARWVETDELVGGWVAFHSGGGAHIIENTAGAMEGTEGVDLQLARITLDQPAANQQDQGDLVFPRALVVFPDLGQTKSLGLRVSLYNGGTTTGGTSVRNTMEPLTAKVYPAFGEPLALEHGRANRRQSTARYDQVENEYIRRRRPLGRHLRQTTATWQTHTEKRSDEPIKRSRDHVCASPGGTPIQAEGQQGGVLRALLERWESEGTIVLYVPRYDRTKQADLILEGWAGGAILGTVEGPWTEEHAGHGEEGRDELVRLGAIKIKELP